MLTNKSTDFIVGVNDFTSLEIREGDSGGKFYYFYDNKEHRLIKQFVLDTSKTGIKTCCSVTFIQKENKYTPRLELSNRKYNELQKEVVDSDNETKNVSSRISLVNCHQNFWSLIDYIQSLKQVEIPRGNWVAISKTDKKLLDSIELNKDFIQKVLSSFTTSKAQELLIEAKKDDVNNLFASVKHAKNKRALNEIDNLVINEVSEHKLEEWVKENDWVFGIEYVRRLDATKIGLHSDADLLVESLDGFVDLIELKKSSVKPLFIHDTIHDCYYPSSPLPQVIGQTIHYLRVMEDQRLLLKSEDGLNVLKPRAKIVIGLSSAMCIKEKESLRNFNDTLHNIEILTYDEIKQRARRIVDHYSEINEDKKLNIIK